MRERSSCALRLGIDRKAHGAELHLDDRVMSVAPLRGGSKPRYVPRLDIGQDPFERDGRNVVTLIHDHVTVGCDDIVHGIAADDALQHGDVQTAVRLTFAAPDPPNELGVNAEEHGKLVHPLIEQRLAMHKDQCAACTLRNQIGADHRLPRAGRCDKHAHIVREHCSRCIALYRRQLSVERDIKRIAANSLVIDRQSDPVFAEQIFKDR